MSNVKTVEIRNEVEDESIFQKLEELPDSETMDKSCRSYNLDQSNKNEKIIQLYNLAKVTFETKLEPQNEMFIKANKVKAIKYHENDKLTEKYKDCKEYFKAVGIPVTEKLVFHGTNDVPISIFSKGFELHRVRRTAMGYGIYFSDFAATSLSYGKNLIISRILVGRPYVGDMKGRGCISAFHSDLSVVNLVISQKINP